jgi:hypothetical protein
VPDTQQGTEGQQILKIKLPEAQTPELDGNFRSWGRGGTRPPASKAASRELEIEAAG